MIVSMKCIDKDVDRFMSKTGQRTLHVMVLQDEDWPPLRNTVDYVMSQEEFDEHGSHLVGKVVKVGIKNITVAFNGRVRFDGRLIVDGATVKK